MSVGRASPAVAATSSLLYVIGGDQTSEVNDFYRAQVRYQFVFVCLGMYSFVSFIIIIIIIIMGYITCTFTGRCLPYTVKLVDRKMNESN